MRSVPSILALTLTSTLSLSPWLMGCEEPPEPVYDDELGLQAVSTEPGALEGAWGFKSSTLGLAELPIIGEQYTGGDTYMLVEREWDGEAYTETHTVCGGRIFDTDASTSYIEEDVWRLVAPSTPTVRLDPELGTYEVDDYIELWGIDLPEPLTTPLPIDGEDAKVSPHAERIFDFEDDGNPGATMAVGGVIEADVFFIQRKINNYRGLVLGDDELTGLVEWTKEQITLDATNPLLNGNLDQQKHPDPKEHWFHSVRVDSADCDTVMQAVEDGDLARLRPF
mgnify:CR=1 FL=1